jgi:hypothetical protein
MKGDIEGNPLVFLSNPESTRPFRASLSVFL